MPKTRWVAFVGEIELLALTTTPVVPADCGNGQLPVLALAVHRVRRVRDVEHVVARRGVLREDELALHPRLQGLRRRADAQLLVHDAPLVDAPRVVSLRDDRVAGRRGQKQRSHLTRPQRLRHPRLKHDALGRLRPDQRAVRRRHAQHEVRRRLDRERAVRVEHEVAPLVLAGGVCVALAM